MSETYSLSCSGCRWAFLNAGSLEFAAQLAKSHAREGHTVEVRRERRERVATYGAPACEVRRG